MSTPFSFYVDIRIHAGNIVHELLGRLVTAAHYDINAGNQLAISFPDWKGTPGDFGFVFRVFGSETAIQTYLKRVSILDREELLSISNCTAVPEVDQFIVFARDRSVDKFSDSYVRRLKRRAEKRGESFQLETKDCSIPHYLPMYSHTSGKPFHLFVKKLIGRKEYSGGNNYGLGFAVPEF
jgi:CRISPR-associated endoribonuclease Cas6/Csy4 subtype I-F